MMQKVKKKLSLFFISQWCMSGQCVNSTSLVSNETCIYGDAFITGSSGSYAMTCEDGLYNRSVASRKTLKTICQGVGDNCCSTCKSKLFYTWLSGYLETFNRSMIAKPFDTQMPQLDSIYEFNSFILSLYFLKAILELRMISQLYFTTSCYNLVSISLNLVNSFICSTRSLKY